MKDNPQLESKYIRWWKELSDEDSEAILKAEGIYGHDIGITENDLKDFYARYNTAIDQPIPSQSASIETVEQAAARIINTYPLFSKSGDIGVDLIKRQVAINAMLELAQWQSNSQQQVDNIVEKINKLISIQERSAVRYKACFGEQNPGGEQIYRYFAILLKDLLPNKPQ